MNEQNTKEDFIRKICDKQTIDAINLLKVINKSKYNIVEDKITKYYQKTRTPIDFETYLELVKNIDKEISIMFHRKNDNFGLDEIEDE